MPVTVVLCAACGSHLVDVRGWRTLDVAVLRCATCGHESTVAGFTVGRVYQGDLSAMVAEAIEDAAMPIAGGR
jgi:ribosomal protein S27E